MKLRSLVGLLVVLAGCAGGGQDPNGNQVVYDRIKAETDCVKLQDEFDIADAAGKRSREAGNLEQASVSTSYMEAAEARRQELGC